MKKIFLIITFIILTSMIIFAAEIIDEYRKMIGKKVQVHIENVEKTLTGKLDSVPSGGQMIILITDKNKKIVINIFKIVAIEEL